MDEYIYLTDKEASMYNTLLLHLGGVIQHVKN